MENIETKKALIEVIRNKLNIQEDLLNEKNGTISKDALIAISNGITIFNNQKTQKSTLINLICNQLGLAPNSEYFNEDNSTVSALFFEDVKQALEGL